MLALLFYLYYNIQIIIPPARYSVSPKVLFSRPPQTPRQPVAREKPFAAKHTALRPQHRRPRLPMSRNWQRCERLCPHLHAAPMRLQRYEAAHLHRSAPIPAVRPFRKMQSGNPALRKDSGNHRLHTMPADTTAGRQADYSNVFFILTYHANCYNSTPVHGKSIIWLQPDNSSTDWHTSAAASHARSPHPYWEG